MAENFAFAMQQIFAPANLLLLVAGGIAGIIVGCLPGLTATMALALLVPFTFTMPPASGLIMLGGLYVGAMFGDAIPATLINTPGTPSAIATTFDGYPLARKGLAQHALVGNALSSFFGGIVGTVCLLALSPPLAELGLKFGPPEYFWMAIFGLTIIGTIASDSILKGLTAGGLGLLLSTIGLAPIAGDVRFTFGIPSLQVGLNLMVALIGFFCIPQILEMVEVGAREYQLVKYRSRKGVFREVFSYLIRRPILLLRSSIIGVLVGIIPGAGGNIASLLSYNEAVRWAKHPEEYGKGTLEGIAATEAANCSVVQGSLIPMLTLGIPGSPAAAVILGALLLHGMQPGPELYTSFGGITYTFTLSFFLATVVMFIFTVWGSPIFARIISVPMRHLVPLIALLSIIGSYAIRNNFLDVVMMLVLGIVGYGLKKLGLQAGAFVLGLLMGPFAEQGLVQSMLMGQAAGSVVKVLFTRPISLILIVMSAASIVWPFIASWRKGVDRQSSATVTTAAVRREDTGR